MTYYGKPKSETQLQYEEILILVMDFLSNHDYISDLSVTEVFNFVDDIHQLMKKLNKEVKKWLMNNNKTTSMMK